MRKFRTLELNPLFLLSEGWQGAFWKILSCAAFAIINGLVRYLAGGAELSSQDVLPTHVILFFQNIFGSLFLLLLMVPDLDWRQAMISLSPVEIRHPLLHLLRVITAVLGVSLWYLSLKYMPIAEGVALTFTGPIFTVIGASLFLGEKLTFYRFLATLASIIGAFVISRPDIALLSPESKFGWAAILPLASAITLAFSKIFTRKLAKKGESPKTLATYLLVLMVPISLVPAAIDWVSPQWHHWPILILLGLLASIAHFAFSKAYALAEVTFLTPFGFSKFLFSTLVGVYFFSEIPSSALWIGMSIIGFSIFMLGRKA